jgi:hypothetical protein
MTRQHERYRDQKNPDAEAEARSEVFHGPYWLRAHRDWKFWAVICVMFVAIGTYVFTSNLAVRPGAPKRPVEGVIGTY